MSKKDLQNDINLNLAGKIDTLEKRMKLLEVAEMKLEDCKDFTDLAAYMKLKGESEWKELDISDLSDCPDILTGDYDFTWNPYSKNKVELFKNTTLCERVSSISQLGEFKHLFYQKTQPKPKTNEELAKEYSRLKDDSYENIHLRVRKAFIAGRESR